MSWSSRSKDLNITKVQGHFSADPKVIGRALGISSIQFSPLALYGAAARCSSLHVVNPHIVTPESLVVEYLMREHVDDVSSDFAIQSSADALKDFVKSYFAGTVAQGLAYLTMIQDHYVWSDHFENVSGGSVSAAKRPDFVFTGRGTGVALMEAKGSRTTALTTFDHIVKNGYLNQVHPHLGHNVGSVTATHGYCIGSHLRSTTKAELRIHHTNVPALSPSGGGRGADPGSVNSVQRGNYAIALSLSHGTVLGRAIRTGEAPARIAFLRFRWRGRTWLTSRMILRDATQIAIDLNSDATQQLTNPYTFAIEEETAQAVFARFFDREEVSDTADLPIAVTELSEGDADGAIFPDGLAVIGSEAELELDRAVILTPGGSSGSRRPGIWSEDKDAVLETIWRFALPSKRLPPRSEQWENDKLVEETAWAEEEESEDRPISVEQQMVSRWSSE